MAKTKRDLLRRELAQALHHLAIAKEDIGTVWTAFDGVHEDYAGSLVLIGEAITTVEQAIVQFWEWAWGSVPENIDSYRC